jgi:phage gpG-like protein
MPGLRFTFEVDGVEQISRGFSRFADGVRDLSPAWNDIAKDFHDVEAKQFESEGSSGSGGWRPLSPRYAAWKARHYPSRGILVRTGTLRGSLTGKNEGYIERKAPLELTLGTAVSYAAAHQRGTRRMPRRPIIELNEGDKRRWSKFVQATLVQRAKESGLL